MLKVLKPYEFHVASKEKVLIHGPSGSGKSTFMKSFLGLSKNLHQDVEVLWKNEKVTDFPSFRSQICSICLQDLNLIDGMTVKDQFLLRSLPYSDFKELSLDKNIEKLSEGQKQKLAFYLYLHKPHEILFLDEPTSSLDTLSAQNIFQQIAHHDKSTVVISHDLRWKHLFDRVVSIDEIQIQRPT